MAESLVQVTEGSGKKLHTFQRTIGANNVEDEVIIQGENYLASYTVIDGAALSTANSHLLQIMAGASLKVRVRRIEIHQSAAVTTGGPMRFDLYRVTTAGTGGTAITAYALDTADPAPGATCMRIPTVKGTLGTPIFVADAYLQQTYGASTPQSSPIAVWDFDRPRSKPLIIPAGAANGIVVINETAQAAGTVDIVAWFDESSF